MPIKSAGKTDIGLVRKVNEDSIKVRDDYRLYLVCDGMGGHNAGEIASSVACSLITELYGRFFTRLLGDERLRLPRIFPPSTDVLAKSVRIANHLIYTKASSELSLSGMGTTIAAITIENDIATILHVGDSRVYLYHNNNLTRLTIDHSWAAEIEQNEKISAEEARMLVNRNVITRALGVREAVDIDVSTRKVTDGEIYILCSDGLCGFVEDSDIQVVISNCGGNEERIVNDLVQLANDRGGTDNVSVIAVKVSGEVEPSELSVMNTVTIDAESPDYFEAEDEWARQSQGDNNRSGLGANGRPQSGRLYAIALIVFLIVLIISYLLLRK